MIDGQKNIIFEKDIFHVEDVRFIGQKDRRMVDD
jgi:hypothetical protein